MLAGVESGCYSGALERRVMLAGIAVGGVMLAGVIAVGEV